MKRFLTTLIVFMLLIGTSKAETKFKVNQTYSGYIQLDNDSKGKQIPLPEGEWIVAAVDSKGPHSNGTELVQVFLINEVDKKLKGITRFTYAYRNYYSGWRGPHKQCGYGGNLHVKDNGMYDGTESDCWRVWGINMTTAKAGAPRESLDFMQSRGLAVPTQVIGVEYYRFKQSNFYVTGYFKNPEFDGISKPDSSDSKLHDYKPDRIGQFPEKKAYVDKFIEWSVGWKKNIDLGFEGRLTEEIMGKSVARDAKSKMKNDSTDVEAKLLKLQSLLEKGLITPEDAAIKRKQILESF